MAAPRPAIPALPRPTAGDPASILNWANQLVSTLEQTIRIIQSPGGVTTPYAVTNLTPSRTLNAGTATLSQAAELLGTLVSDLQAKGTIN